MAGGGQPGAIDHWGMVLPINMVILEWDVLLDMIHFPHGSYAGPQGARDRVCQPYDG